MAANANPPLPNIVDLFAMTTTKRQMTRLSPSMLLVSLCFSVLLGVCRAAGQERGVQILNQSGHRINVYWINRWNHDELVINNKEPVLFGADMSINSYVTHEFEIQEVVHSKTGVCSGPDGICRSVQFQVNENEGQVITVKQDFAMEHVDNKSIARDQAKKLLQECKAKVTSDPSKSGEETMEHLFECVNTGLSEELEKSQEEIDFQRGIRTKIGSHLATYACADNKLNTTSAIKNETYTEPNNVSHRIRVLHDHTTAQIHYVEKFVSDKECEAVMKETTLKPVSEDEGLVGKRGAVPMDKKSHFVAIQERVLGYTQGVFGTSSLKDHHQADLVAISYSGEGMPDQYHPHCDGRCDGGDYQPGDRIATMILYCQTADEGGSTIFHNSGVHIKPTKGDAVFVSYVDPSTGNTDSGFTEYSGCPVRKGEKYEVLQYVRMG